MVLIYVLAAEVTQNSQLGILTGGTNGKLNWIMSITINKQRIYLLYAIILSILFAVLSLFLLLHFIIEIYVSHRYPGNKVDWMVMIFLLCFTGYTAGCAFFIYYTMRFKLGVWIKKKDISVRISTPRLIVIESVTTFFYTVLFLAEISYYKLYYSGYYVIWICIGMFLFYLLFSIIIFPLSFERETG